MASPLVARHRHVLEVSSAESITLRGDSGSTRPDFRESPDQRGEVHAAGGRIEVAIEQAPGRVRVTVRDNGRGIARDQLGRIFEPFVQADREQDALRGGLGLAWPSSTTWSNGTEAPSRCRARVEDAARPSRSISHRCRTEVLPVPTTPPSSFTARASVRVLVVDDNVDIAELLSDALQDEGFQTAIAHDAHGALESGAASFRTPPFWTWGFRTSTGTSSRGRCAPSTARTPR